MSANIVNVVHKEGRQAGSLLFGPYIMPVFVRHAACSRLASKKLSQLIRQQRVENRARAPKQTAPASVAAAAASALAASK